MIRAEQLTWRHLRSTITVPVGLERSAPFTLLSVEFTRPEKLLRVSVTGVRLTADAYRGAKPAAWTRWVLDALGYDPDTDTVADLFPGSGAVTAEIAQGVLL